MRALELVCPSCGSAIAGSDVNVARAIALCRGCNTLFDIGSSTAAAKPRSLVAVEVPKDIQVSRDAGALALEYKWARAQGLMMLPFVVIWDGFLAVWYSIALASLAQGSPTSLVMVLFPVLHVAAGVTLTLSTLSNLLNTTRIEVRKGVIQVAVGPIPMGARGTFRTDGIQQLFVDRRPSKWLQRFSTKSTQQSGQEVFRVCALGADGSIAPLVDGITSVDVARAIERLVEDHLGIVDAPVPGEEAEAPSEHRERTLEAPEGGTLSLPSADGGELAEAKSAGGLSHLRDRIKGD